MDSQSTESRLNSRAGLRQAVEPYDYNPSAWSQRVPISILAFVAAGITVYMSLFQWGWIDTIWDPVFGGQTAKVLKSDLAERMFLLIGIHDSAMGTIAYLGDAILGLAGSTRRWQYRPWLVILFGIDVIPLGIVSSVLVAAQGLVVGSWCFLCLVTAAISLVLVYWAWDEVRVSLLYLWRVKQRSQSWKTTWNAFCGFPDPISIQVGNHMVGHQQ